MGVPSASGVDGVALLRLLKARLNGQEVAGGDPVFIRNARVSYSEEEQIQVLEWLSTAEILLQGNVTAGSKFEVFNTFLKSRTVFVGSGTHITLADLGMFLSLRDSLAAFPEEEREKLPNLFRWFDYVQNKDNVRQVYQLVPIVKPDFFPPNLSVLDPSTKSVPKPAAPNGNVPGDKPAEKPETKQSPAKAEGVSPEVISCQSAITCLEQVACTSGVSKEEPSKKDVTLKHKPEKEKKEKPPAQKKEIDCDVSVLDLCVGQIKKVWKHPSADSLYVEEIDIGAAQPRQVVSGLVKYVSETEMMNRRVVVLLNVKPGKVRDVLSSGVVLCASNEDHSKCEPLAPPEGVSVGERVKFSGHDGKPEEVLNPKKKQWEKISLELRTDAQGVANYQGVPFQTSGGVCKSSIVNGTVK